MRVLLPHLAVLLWSFSASGQEAPGWPVLKEAADKTPLEGTGVLDWEGDLAMRMVDGVDAFMDREIAAAMASRGANGGSREELARKLGITRDARPEKNGFERGDLVSWGTSGVSVRRVRWRAFGQVDGMGLLIEPNGSDGEFTVIALPDADLSPEEISGAEKLPGSGTITPFAARMATAGCRVLVPVLINRNENEDALTNREWLHRPAWELGRTLAGYEVQKILAAVDCIEGEKADGEARGKIAVVGWGEGGRLAIYAAALDERIDGALVSGYFGPRQRVWDEPADRNVFGLLHGHSDRQLATLIAPRPLTIEVGHYPQFGFRLDAGGIPERLNRGAGKRGKPGKLLTPTAAEVREEAAGLGESVEFRETERAIANESWESFLRRLGMEVPMAGAGVQQWKPEMLWGELAVLKEIIARRQAEQIEEIDRHNQWALIDSQRVRADCVKGLNPESIAKYEESTKPLRAKFSKEVIGEYASLQALPAPNPRSRAFQEGEKTVSYEVVLDVHEGVFAYGILTLPKDLKLDGSERRPVVVCQHGLEGRPQSTVGEPDHHYYKAFATRLAERGFVTFAPQNIYIGQDKFRILQFKANALGCTLYSIMVPQHRQITNWLASLPFVDPDRIGFYGLSYGGKTAMRVPPLVERYCLSICSADFNEWIWKNAATDAHSLRYSYANKGEYEIFEFDLGNTFNYYEMAALIAPRPFMVERGHFDGVAPDETVGYEFAKVRHLYAARLGIGDRTEIEWFVGPHSINGVGTFAFLHRHLDWPGRE